jgi:pimeloyl-ACP methyl ester carboxylesterase
MQQVLFIQGGGAGAHDAWDDKLAAGLARELGPDYDVLYPRMPDEADPSYRRWSAFLRQEFARLDDGAILVGHSIGGTILLHTLAERPPARRWAGLVLIAAPFVGKGGWPIDEIPSAKNLGARLPQTLPIHLFHGSEDDTAPPSHLDLYAAAIPQAMVHRLKSRDHQLNNDLREVADTIRSLR